MEGEARQSMTRQSLQLEGTSISGGMLITKTADASVLELGFAPFGLPPHTITVKELATDGWAAGQGINVGDELQSVGRTEIKDLTKDEFERKLKHERPLRLSFLRPAGAGKAKHDNDVEQQVGKLLRKIVKSKTEMLDVLERMKVLNDEIGDVQRDLKQVSAQAHHTHDKYDGDTNGEQKASPEIIAALKKVTEELEEIASVTLHSAHLDQGTFRKGSQESLEDSGSDSSEDEPPYTVEVRDGIGHLGFYVKRETSGYVFVEVVEPGSWAEKQNIEAEDCLHSINDLTVSQMSKGDLVKNMKSRPVKLTFLPR